MSQGYATHDKAAGATRYKLTTQNMETHNGFLWEIGEWYEQQLGGMCGPGGFHAYTSPLLAILLNPIHAYIQNPRLWEAEVGGDELTDNGLKTKHAKMRLLRELPVPSITTEQRVTFAVLCVLETGNISGYFREWANDWLSGENRTQAAAAAAADEEEAAAAWAAAAAAAAARAPIDLIAIAERAVS